MLREVTVLFSDGEYTAVEAARAEFNERLKAAGKVEIDIGKYAHALVLHGLLAQASAINVEEAKKSRIQPARAAILGPDGRPMR